MRKKILVAEKSDAIRVITESILHQNGYDVITASSTEKAKELVITAEPNMVIIGADLKDADGKYLYDLLEENERTTSIPLLLIADPEGKSLPYPDEVILPRPFDPKDFLDRVKLFVGGGIETTGEEKIETADPFSAEAVDDEFLDAALGIDRIEVENSEIMDKTWGVIRQKSVTPPSEKDAFAILQPEDTQKIKAGDGHEVESIMIRDDGKSVASDKKTKEQQVSTSPKIEIDSDQYGLINPDEAVEPESIPPKPTHNYDWFLKEMQKESAETGTAAQGKAVGIQEPSPAPTHETAEPTVSQPIGETASAGTNEAKEPEIKPGGVDQFISEFKKEVEQISVQPVETPTARKAVDPLERPVTAKEDIKGEEPVDLGTQADPAEVRHFTNYLVELLSEKLAKMIVEKIDKDEIHRMIRDDLARLLTQRK